MDEMDGHQKALKSGNEVGLHEDLRTQEKNWQWVAGFAFFAAYISQTGKAAYSSECQWSGTHSWNKTKNIEKQQ